MHINRKVSNEWIVSASFRVITTMAAAAVLILLFGIVALLTGEAGPAYNEFGFGFIFGRQWNPVAGREVYGIIAAIYGTLATSLIAMLLAAPLGIGTAILLSEDLLAKQLRNVLSLLVELLAAIPSVVYGLWGIFVLIPLVTRFGQVVHNTLGWIPLFGTAPVGPGLLSASLVLGVMIIPIITAVAKDSLIAVPESQKLGSYALGADRWTTVFTVALPQAAQGIAGGFVLGLGRALGETMAVTMLIGNANQISLSLFDPARTLSSLIANQFAEAEGLQISALMYAGIVLLVITLITNIIAQVIISRFSNK